MSDSPMVTVCMPVYNAARYLGLAMESILGQTFADLEFLVLDDGSTDASLEIARKRAEGDARVLVQTFAHKGYAPLLNLGLSQARGRYFARMDADDVAAPTRLERQVAFLEQHGDVLAVGAQATIIDADGDPVEITAYPLRHEEIDGAHTKGRMRITHPTLTARTEGLRKVGGYRPEFEPAEDFDLVLRLAEAGGLANLPESLLQYRMHPQQVTVRRYESQSRAMRQALEEAGQRRGVVLSAPDVFIHPRPSSPWQVSVVWAECAWRAGFRKTALKHAFRAVSRRPWSRTAWKVLYRSAFVAGASAPGSSLVS